MDLCDQLRNVNHFVSYTTHEPARIQHQSNFLSTFSCLIPFTLQSRYFDCDDDIDSDTFSNLSAAFDAEEYSKSADIDDTLYYCDDGFCSYGSGDYGTVTSSMEQCEENE